MTYTCILLCVCTYTVHDCILKNFLNQKLEKNHTTVKHTAVIPFRTLSPSFNLCYFIRPDIILARVEFNPVLIRCIKPIVWNKLGSKFREYQIVQMYIECNLIPTLSTCTRSLRFSFNKVNHTTISSYMERIAKIQEWLLRVPTVPGRSTKNCYLHLHVLNTEYLILIKTEQL